MTYIYIYIYIERERDFGHLGILSLTYCSTATLQYCNPSTDDS